ncbi:LytR/AlgR family response regulator transcription factor [Aureibacter tunicatorum]|uniref:DNA-binding LytR/AlgR family response regulator n=1 Tax=Aureibacter tunicatorum TaxID=866807 RepID=A0AAE4BUG2_9BACT|nr:LytTR family DNA-binding domain-containing protein [Aureibacter tunicatorum]MDR6240717.1 DNA-binding LytR/AlgR family response regulator [Aureibacter tunicatorum]BDD06950.1 DNA-binding response regulator [Aureibacter tunicatorum]
MKSIRCIIVDDEQLARKLLESYVEKLPNVELLGMFKNPLEAISFLRDNDVDLMFLDIQMPDLKGTDLLRSLSVKPKVILTTAYQEYALEGFELGVADYLLKPISFERFLSAVNKVEERMNSSRGNDEIDKHSHGSFDEEEDGFLTLKGDHKFYKVHFGEILYIEGMREYVAFHTVERKLVILVSLKHLEETLPSARFMRVHKSYIVNKKFAKVLYGNQIEINDKLIPIGKSYVEKVRKELFGLSK